MIHPHSQAYHLLGLIAVCGELPADAIHRLPISESYRYKVIASLKSQKLIRLFGRDGIKGYRLTPVAKKLRDAVLYGGGYAAQFIRNFRCFMMKRRLYLSRPFPQPSRNHPGRFSTVPPKSKISGWAQESECSGSTRLKTRTTYPLSRRYSLMSS